jgi:hypothetical protein
MALYRARGSKTWQVRRMINGKLFVRSTTTTNKKQAEQIARQYEREWVSHAVLNEKQPVSLAKALDTFLAGKRNESGWQTWAIHARIIGRYFDTDIALHHLSSADVASFVQRRRQEGKSDDTIRLSLSTLRGAVKTAEQMGYAVCSMRPNRKSTCPLLTACRNMSVSVTVGSDAYPFVGNTWIAVVTRSTRQIVYRISKSM